MNKDITYKAPFLLQPSGKDYLWGGSRLNDDFSKNIDLSPLAETWECSTHPDGPSFCCVCGRKQTLRELLASHPGMMGTHPLHILQQQKKSGIHIVDGDLPVLVKFIDAANNLSVQVHPDDEYAMKHENAQAGKTEMWYVVDAAAGAELIYGFRRNVTQSLIKNALKNDTIELYLQKVSVHKGDIFFITPGTVHAIGKGCLILEIQETSNLTYRLYDYHRLDKNGHERTLHIDKALDVMNLKASSQPRQPMQISRYRRGMCRRFLFRCRYFEVSLLSVNTERIRELALMRADQASFHVLVCTDGCGSALWQGGSLQIFRGDSLFIPADSVPIRLHGKMELVDIHC